MVKTILYPHSSSSSRSSCRFKQVILLNFMYLYVFSCMKSPWCRWLIDLITRSNGIHLIFYDGIDYPATIGWVRATIGWVWAIVEVLVVSI